MQRFLIALIMCITMGSGASIAQATTVVHISNKHIHASKQLAVTRHTISKPIVRIVANPILSVRYSVLPRGYTRVFHNGHSYYYHSGTYYQKQAGYYVVVKPVVDMKLVRIPG